MLGLREGSQRQPQGLRAQKHLAWEEEPATLWKTGYFSSEETWALSERCEWLQEKLKPGDRRGGRRD